LIQQLHPKTLETLADLICADNTADYRSAAAITKFLQRAQGAFPEHDGQTSRRNWVLKLLHECNEAADDEFCLLDRSSLEAVMLQLVDPREYGGEFEAVRQMIVRLNRVLATERLLVSLDGATPRLQAVSGHIATAETTGAQYVMPDFSKLTTDPIVAANLKMRWEEAQRCIAAKAHLATVLLLGSILEGVLIVMIQANPAEANHSSKSPKDTSGKAKTFREWSLHDCIEVACDCGWLQGDRLRFSHALRESRNLIHPLLQRMVGEWPNEHTCRICWEVVNAAIADLLNHVDAPPHPR
jgi:hypothetical protein